MNSSQTISINSKLVADGIDSQLIQLVKILQVERSCSFEDALTTARDHLNKKVIELMLEDDVKIMKDIVSKTRTKLKKDPENEDNKNTYAICKYFGLIQHLK